MKRGLLVAVVILSLSAFVVISAVAAEASSNPRILAMMVCTGVARGFMGRLDFLRAGMEIGRHVEFEHGCVHRAGNGRGLYLQRSGRVVSANFPPLFPVRRGQGGRLFRGGGRQS